MKRPHAAAVIRRAEAMSRDQPNAGAAALPQQANPDTAEFDGAVILKALGEVPEDFAGTIARAKCRLARPGVMPLSGPRGMSQAFLLPGGCGGSNANIPNNLAA
jgi:hypothetical protein